MARTVREIYLKEFTDKTSKRHAFLTNDSHHDIRHFYKKYVMEFTQSIPATNASAGRSNELLSITALGHIDTATLKAWLPSTNAVKAAALIALGA